MFNALNLAKSRLGKLTAPRLATATPEYSFVESKKKYDFSKKLLVRFIEELKTLNSVFNNMRNQNSSARFHALEKVEPMYKQQLEAIREIILENRYYEALTSLDENMVNQMLEAKGMLTFNDLIEAIKRRVREVSDLNSTSDSDKVVKIERFLFYFEDYIVKFARFDGFLAFTESDQEP